MAKIENEPEVVEPAVVETPQASSEVTVDVPEYQTEYVTENNIRRMMMFPTISAGRCEFCGSREYVGGQVTRRVNKEGHVSYAYTGGKWVDLDATKCKHYKKVNIRCSYCGEQFTAQVNRAGVFTEILGTRNLFVGAFPEAPNTLVMWCTGYECMLRHQKRIGLITK